jgi:CheY-like chemotaxis protein
MGNLLHNAAKFTPKGGRVHVRAALSGSGSVRIAVQDNGIGIAADNLPRIFGMFTQAAVPPDLAPEGLGIGLSLVSRLLEMHGGRLTASSPGIGLGSTFTVELPVLRADRVPHTDAGTERPGQGPADGLRVLLVDDNADAIEMMGCLLDQMGHQAFMAGEALQILPLMREHRPDVVVLDIGLPGVDGYELARMIRREPGLESTRLVAHTGYGSPEDRKKALDAGFDAHLVKPAELGDLEAALRGK